MSEDFKHPLFVKSRRELAIDALCEVVRKADTAEERRKAENALVNYIEGTDA